MEDGRIGVAIIGFGWVTRFFHIPMIASVRGLKLVAIGTTRPAEVARVDPSVRVERPEAAIALEDVDLVVIAGVNETHYPLAKLALESGKHVVVEKPFTPTLSEARALAELASRVGRHLSVFQNRRWDSDYLTVRDAIRSGDLGEIVHFESHIDRYAPHVPHAWREQPGPAAGTWFDLGPHVGDQALLEFGLPERVVASFSQQRYGARLDDWFTVILEYLHLRVVLRAAQVVPGARFRFVVHGKQKSFVKFSQDVQELQLQAGMTPSDVSYGIDPDDGFIFDQPTDHFDERRAVKATRGNQAQYYVELERAIRGHGPNPVAPAEGVALMSLLETAAQCASDGIARPLPLTLEERSAFEVARAMHL